MRLIGNAETIDRLVEQGVYFCKLFTLSIENDPTGSEAEFLRGEFSRLAQHFTYRVPRLRGRNRGPRSRQNLLAHPGVRDRNLRCPIRLTRRTQSRFYAGGTG